MFILCLASACMGSTFVGELFPREPASTDGSAPGDDAPVQSDAPRGGTAGVSGTAGVAGGGSGGIADGGRGGIVAPIPTELILQPAPDTSEDLSLVTINGVAAAPDDKNEVLGVETTTFDGTPVVRRGLVRFRIPFQLEPTQVLQAHLVLTHQPDRVAHIVGTRWRIGRAVGPWEASSLTWANQPQEASDALLPAPPDSPRTDFRIDVSTIVRSAIAAKESPAFTLRLVDETTIGQHVLFCASDHDIRICRPALHLALSPQP